MEPEKSVTDLVTVTILFQNGSTMETDIEEAEFDNLDSQLDGRPRWMLIGDVWLHSHNLVAIQPSDEEGA